MTKRLLVSKKLLRTLSLDQLVELDSTIRQLIQEAKADKKRHASQKRDNAQGNMVDYKTHRQVFIRCGKEGCKCADGPGHGPYWYAYWSENGHTRCQYIGKKLKKEGLKK